MHDKWNKNLFLSNDLKQLFYQKQNIHLQISCFLLIHHQGIGEFHLVNDRYFYDVEVKPGGFVVGRQDDIILEEVKLPSIFFYRVNVTRLYSHFH